MNGAESYTATLGLNPGDVFNLFHCVHPCTLSWRIVGKYNFVVGLCNLIMLFLVKNKTQYRINYHKLAAHAHELGLPCVICELLFVKLTLCIYPFHVCKYDVISRKWFHIINQYNIHSFIHG